MQEMPVKDKGRELEKSGEPQTVMSSLSPMKIGQAEPQTSATF